MINKSAVTFFLLVNFLFVSFSFADLRSHNNSCYASHISRSGSANASQVTNFLDCLVQDDELSQVAAQWILIRKSHWILQDDNRLSSKQYKTIVKGVNNSHNAMNPKQKHLLKINFARHSNFSELISWLESKVFLEILNGKGSRSDSAYQNVTAWSFDASFHHYLAYHDIPLKYSARYKKEGARSGYYKGTLLESAGWPSQWYNKTKNGITDRNGRKLTTAFTVLDLSPLGNKFWPQLRGLYDQLDENDGRGGSRCLYRQERKAVQALYTLLDHPDLVRKVHFTRLRGFGPQRSDKEALLAIDVSRYSADKRVRQQQIINDILAYDPFGKMESLPRSVGYLGLTREVSATADLNWDYSFTGRSTGYVHLDYTQFGVHGLIGRPLYIEAFNKSIRVNINHAAFFQGQNAIVRDITQNAVNDLKRMGGLGGPKSSEVRQLDGYVIHPSRRPSVMGDASNAQIITDKQSIANVVAQADAKIEQLFPSGSASFYAADFGRSKRSKSHPVNKRAYFKETIVSFGYSLTWWMNYLNGAKQQPNLRYYLIGYDYSLRPRPNKVPHFKSYYDRVTEVVSNERNLFRKFSL